MISLREKAMRRTRWLFLAAILGILTSIGATYFNRKGRMEKDAPPPPKPLESGIDASIPDWVYTKSDGERPVVQVRAKSFRQMKDQSVSELDGLELRLYHKDGSEFDLVHSAHARFDMSAKVLYSEGDVDITMGVPEDGPPHGRVVKIHSSGVSFQSETGKATTDRKTDFEFDQGGGSAIGAEYDPETRELHLRSAVALDWRGRTADFVPMHIEAGEAYYKERDAKVYLLPWSKLTRDTLHIEAGTTVVTLQNGDIREAEAVSGHGVKDDPDRKVEFAADQLKLEFADGMVVNKIVGNQNGRLVSTAQTMRTTVTANQLDLDFVTSGKESTLASAVATGKSVAEAQPLPKPGTELAETRILRSDILRLKMKAGGRDIDNVETDGPGTLDFLPNRPGQPKRWMKGDRIWIAYGDENRIQSFRSINVSTRTDKPAEPGQPAPPPALTSSKEIFATFDPKTSDLSHMEQKTDFRYQEGVRQARADRATLEQQQNKMTLDGSARIWDPTGSATADHILMDQKSGDFTAEGRVASTRQPDQNGKSSAMLSTEEVMQARAQRMVSTNNNLKIHYEGNAVAWQGANRVEADRIDIDRDGQVMEAHGKVISQFVDKDKAKSDDGAPAGSAPPVAKQVASKPTASKPVTAPIFTVVRAPDMVYSEETRLVVYSGGAALKRPNMTVTGREIRAFLKDANSDSSLDKAFADGAVQIVNTSPVVATGQTRVRTGTSEHAEYYADDQKVILQNGDPQLVDSIKGKTRGKELTWFANDDRLLINGVDKGSLAKSTVRKK
jgi:lipopolysaccharide export system protein LptA